MTHCSHSITLNTDREVSKDAILTLKIKNKPYLKASYISDKIVIFIVDNSQQQVSFGP